VAAKRERERAAWKQVEEDFAKIADQIPKFTVPQEWRDAVARYLPSPELKGAAVAKYLPVTAPRPVAKPMSGKTWLEGDKAKGIPSGFDRFPRQPDQSFASWAERLSREAAGEGVPIKPSSIETRIHERRRPTKS
jgi:hypothetical protein